MFQAVSTTIDIHMKHLSNNCLLPITFVGHNGAAVQHNYM